MSVYEYKNNELHIENIALSTIAKEIGTPVYCYSMTALEENYLNIKQALKTAMPDADFLIAYACKTNSNVAVMKVLSDLGAGMDIVSSGELTRAIKSGTSTEKIVFSGVGKTDEEILYALKENIWQINVESIPELENISKIATENNLIARIALRINPDVDADTHEKIATGRKKDKFGIDIDEALTAYQYSKTLSNLDVCGIAIHIGSQISKLEPFRKAFIKIAELVQTLKETGINIQHIDVGGGFGITYKDEEPMDFSRFANLLKEFIAPLNCQIILEPGRSIAGDAGILLSKIIYTKHNTHRNFMIIDAAMNDLIRPTLYNAYHPILPVIKDNNAKLRIYDVVGPVCETGDTFMVDEELPDMKQGSLVSLMISGAYGFSMASTYNSRPLVPEVLVKGDKFSVIRQRQTIDEMLAAESLPDWM